MATGDKKQWEGAKTEKIQEKKGTLHTEIDQQEAVNT